MAQRNAAQAQIRRANGARHPISQASPHPGHAEGQGVSGGRSVGSKRRQYCPHQDAGHRADVEGGEAIGVVTIYRKEQRAFTDKQIELVRTSPPRPSSPSRTRGCSTSCANRSSNRRRPPTCSRSSVALRSSYRKCSIRWLNPRCTSVRPRQQRYGVPTVMYSNCPRIAVSLANLRNSVGKIRLLQEVAGR